MIQLPGVKHEGDARDPKIMADWASARWEAIQQARRAADEADAALIGRVYKLLQKLSLLATEEEGIEFPFSVGWLMSNLAMKYRAA